MSDKINEVSEKEDLVIKRIFDAPRELVWSAWTKREHVAKWWGPKDFTTPTAKIDLRIGGKYHFCMRSKEGQDFWITGVYKEIIPNEIIYKAPSAELRPDQKDQDSLPPYDLLDRILKMYLEEQKEFDEITDVIKRPDTIRKVLRLVDLNEFKRRQSAPVLRVSTKAFGYGRRFPIVQGWRK